MLPRVPIVTHLHGTELKMLHAIADPDVEFGPHADWWAERHGRVGARRGRDDRDLAVPAGRGGPPARASMPRPCTGCRMASMSRASRSAGPRSRRAACALARVARPRPAGLGRARGAPAASATPRTPGPATRSSTERYGQPRPVLIFVGRFLGVQAGAAARARLRTGTAPHVGARAARHLGRRAGRVGGRAPAHRRRRSSASTASSSPAGAATASCRSASPAPTASSRHRRQSRSGSCTSRRCRAACRSSAR